MSLVFLIPGYGIPKDIMSDPQYQIYLNLVFNTIYDSTVKHFETKPPLVFSGGNTDGMPPFKRKDFDEMVRFFTYLCQRDAVKKFTRTWKVYRESRSLSTLENFVNMRDLLKQKNIPVSRLFIFLEHVKADFRKHLLRYIFPEEWKTKILSIDFDTSPTRYQDTQSIADKERVLMKYSLWALRKPKNMKKYKQVCKERVAILRSVRPEQQAETLQEWQSKKLEEMKKIT
jgi:hypothetical protein